MPVSDAVAGENGVMASAAPTRPEHHALDAAFQHAAIGIAIGDADGRLRDVNPALTRMLGYTRDELLALHIADMTHPDDRAADAAHWSRMKAGEIDTYQREQRYRRKDGSSLWGLATVSALRDGSGTFLGSSAHVQDISAHKVAEAARRENEARLEALVDQLPIVLYSQPLDGRRVIGYVSPRFERQTGLGRDDLPGDFAELLALSHPDDRHRLMTADERANRTGETTHVQFRLRGGDGEWVWLDHHAVLGRDERGRPLAWHGAIIDISERERLEASRHTSERLFRHAFEGAAIGMAITDRDGACLDANDAYCAILGLQREALIGRSMLDFTHPDDRPAAADRLARLREGELNAYVVEKRYVRPDGEAVLTRLTVSAVRDDAGAFLYGIRQLQDITTQKATESALHEREAILRTLMAQATAADYRLEPGDNGRFTFVSPRFRALTGSSIAESNTTLSDYFALVHPDDRERVLAADAEAARTGEAFDIEYRLRGPGDSWIWVHDCSLPFRDEQGHIVAWHGVLLDISKRKRLEGALRENETRLRSLIEHLPVALYSIGAEPGLPYSYTSPQFEPLTGLTAADLARGTAALEDRTHPDDREAVREASAQADVTGGPFEIEYRLLGADGRWRWIHDRAILAHGPDGQPLAWHGVLLDVSQQRQLEESIRESEARFRSTFEGAAIGMTLATPDCQILMANPALERLLGYGPGELEGLHTETLTYPADRPAHRRARQRLQDGDIDGFQLEKRYVRKDGEIVWVMQSVTAIRDDRGRIQSVIAQIVDISARKEAEAALRESEARFRALVQNDPDVIVIVDQEMTITYVSPTVRAAIGVRPEEVLGPVADALHRIHPADQQSTLALFDEVETRSRAVASAEARLEHIELGWRWFQLTVTNLVDDPGIAGYLFNLRDITERKQAELATFAALKSQQEAIDELERLNQSKSRFLATISHEFRTPLTSIIGYSEFMMMNAANPALIAEDAAVIHREASRLNRLVDDVLLIDRAEAGHISLSVKPVDLNAVAQRVAELSRPITEKHALVLDLDPALPPVDGDLDRLAQALTNLVSNAVKYSPDGGTVTISTRGHDGAVVVSVRDQGLGIAPQDLHRIFDRFERVETGIAGRIAGTGLGLSIVKEIITLHGGRVWVESEPGIGSLFAFAIPASQVTAPDRPDRPPGYTPPHTER